MKKLNDPLSVMRVLRSIILKYRIMVIMLIVTLIPIYSYNNYEKVRKEELFDKLNVNFKEIKAIEYGTANYDPMELVENIPCGEVVSYTESVDTKSIGKKDIEFVVKKDDVYKVVKVEAEVVDTRKPDIEINEDKIEIEVGNSYNAQDNVSSVVDQVDGKLKYVDKTESEDISYYTVTTDLNTEVAGSYEVNVKAVDVNGNVSEKKFTVDVVKKEEPVVEESTELSNNPVEVVNNNVQATVDTTSVVSAAQSFLGYGYTYGGARPETGFDCSGFVYYIYGLFGKNVGRSTAELIYNGAGVSKDSMQPGDIILWDTSFGNTPTHAALYVGDGMMIHAANSRDGVIISSVSSWEMYAGRIVSVRRV
ncbi:MAG: C40 family peptidase [Bacilli bacterium]|nr:C40 family peptidase [Bacilli bacterium]MBR3162016.1 C40 family peptidase [Bacilli bacterium]